MATQAAPNDILNRTGSNPTHWLLSKYLYAIYIIYNLSLLLGYGRPDREILVKQNWAVISEIRKASTISLECVFFILM
jgi:hypothetical protein